MGGGNLNVPMYLVFGIVLVGLATAAWGGWRAAPYVPTYQRDVRRMLRLANVKPDEMVVDLGAGDGRFLITAAREFGARGFGYELSLLPLVIGWVRVLASPVRGRVQLRFGDFFRQNLSSADVVTCFLTPKAMAKLAPKFQRELRAGARVVSYAFSIPGWQPEVIDRSIPKSGPVFVYRLPADVAWT